MEKRSFWLQTSGEFLYFSFFFHLTPLIAQEEEVAHTVFRYKDDTAASCGRAAFIQI